jgi:hypothetical protein
MDSDHSFSCAKYNKSEQVEKGNIYIDDLTNENITDFYSSAYEASKNNDMFKRLNQLINVTIPMAICLGDTKLAKTNGKATEMKDYFKEYTVVIEALVILLFYKQLDYLSGISSNKYKTSDPHENSNDDEATSDSNNNASGPDPILRKKKGGRPSGKEGFCHILHTELKNSVYEHREENHPWYGWYKEALQSIDNINKEWFQDRVRGNLIERSISCADDQQQTDIQLPAGLSSRLINSNVSQALQHIEGEVAEFFSAHPRTNPTKKIKLSSSVLCSNQNNGAILRPVEPMTNVQLMTLTNEYTEQQAQRSTAVFVLKEISAKELDNSDDEECYNFDNLESGIAKV